MYSLFRVNESSYNTCSTQDAIANLTTSSGRIVVLLNDTGHYYFICGNGFCFGGMKMSLLVLERESEESPSPSPTPNGSPSSLSKGLSRAFQCVVLEQRGGL
ncbi:hypothetical protein AMTR_s00058p00113300 [Amborella trichopoda]|uniref:Phytocyanin domain-containing protein n=1 Tax=Amborella trichopoda TaxID=13333 RepID=W1PHE9_AMBTC|nr:hypothetical protein AMTR_s00058p00113300 [Amborella trichopoda]